jgi:hypothetical protein
MFKLMVLPPELALSVIPALPWPRIMSLPANVYPLPEIVIELKAVYWGKSFVVEYVETLAGNTRSSPTLGTVPEDQLPGFVQLPFTLPVHVWVNPSETTCHRRASA